MQILIISRLYKKLLKWIQLTLSQKRYLTGKPIFLNKIQKTGKTSKNPQKSIQGVQKQTCKTDIQESKELAEKVSIRKHNDCSLIVAINVLYSDVENFEG